MRALALVFLTSLAVGTATAADWRLVDDGDLAFIYVDRDSIAHRVHTHTGRSAPASFGASIVP